MTVAGAGAPTGGEGLESVLSVTNSDRDATIHSVVDHADAVFTWDYAKGARPALAKLYEKAKSSQWDGVTDLPWETEVDTAVLFPDDPAGAREGRVMAQAIRLGLPMARWSPSEWGRLFVEQQNWTMSQFLHGEQGALLCTAKIVETVPWVDAKYYAATQVMDEARHVEVFARYIDTKLTGHYPINAHLKMLLDDVISDSRWDMTYLGMQIMVEGLALAAFGAMQVVTGDPLLKQLLRLVMSDEARHVAFGVIALKEYYGELTDAEMKDRQEFAFDAAVRMRDRFAQQEVWERLGVDVPTMTRLIVEFGGNKNEDPFQQMLFSKIVPNCKKLGLLDANGGWLRQRFGELGVAHFEHWADTSEEYDLLQQLA
ncbi:MAG: ferritin-like domain-containing protein [Acidimicrobiia bacterium]